MKRLILPFLASTFVLMLLNSCYVQHPKYSLVEDVMELETGITVDSVNKILACEPHDFISLDTNGTMVLLYKYRVKEIRRVPIIMKRSKGLEVEGHWKDLVVTVSPEGRVVNYQTNVEELQSEAEKKKVDPNKLIQSITTAITVILPALLVYISAN